ncbi:MAG: sensor domain-containing diguanylate cyclase [Candidatus Omnitrophica bacterium]|nr:sensor domain-containing diguanylate cyclase [Candidatus Omnitrophota bacterium]MDD5553648.1 sensor domain-containing diguanylate cyclase [Candidatus Omnitrophota bacterium]
MPKILILSIINIAILYILLNSYFKKRRHLRIQIQDLQEKINILNTENSAEGKNKSSLEEKIRRYKSLKNIVEELDRELDAEFVSESLVRITYSQIAKGKGTATLYLIDSRTQHLSLVKSKKEDDGLVIKAKEGDIFDMWVLRHAGPLLIEDIKKDFRFDLGKIEKQHVRPVSSMISAPLLTDHRLLGVLRLDNSYPGVYSQDDLRFLTAICDLGAVALENSQLFQRTKDLAIHDELTRLYTRGYFRDRLTEECRRGLRQDNVFSLLMLDIDFFKDYNDKFGHTSGDIVLKSLSGAITGSLKDYSPIVSRFGGEEFCVILPSRDKKGAYRIAENLRKKIENSKIILRKQETHVTVSTGLASFPEDSTDADELIRKADKAMYQAKSQGRNRVCCI